MSAYYWLVGCIEDVRRFSGISIISRLGYECVLALPDKVYVSRKYTPGKFDLYKSYINETWGEYTYSSLPVGMA